MKTLIKTVSTFLAIFVINTAQANLISNGSFEQPDVASNSMQYFTSSEVLGWDGRVIEIWDNHTNFAAQEGDQYAELNAHFEDGSAFTLMQSFTTTKGSLYDLSFAYSARFSSDEAFQVDVFSGQTNVFSQLIDDHTKRSWSIFSSSFTALATNSVLKFTAITPSSATTGNFLDNIAVFESADARQVSANTVAEPGSLLLFGTVLLGWCGYRRLSKK
jgi:hypothetical protein